MGAHSFLFLTSIRTKLEFVSDMPPARRDGPRASHAVRIVQLRHPLVLHLAKSVVVAFMWTYVPHLSRIQTPEPLDAWTPRSSDARRPRFMLDSPPDSLHHARSCTRSRVGCASRKARWAEGCIASKSQVRPLSSRISPCSPTTLRAQGTLDLLACLGSCSAMYATHSASDLDS